MSGPAESVPGQGGSEPTPEAGVGPGGEVSDSPTTEQPPVNAPSDRVPSARRLLSGGIRLQHHLARAPSSAARDATRTGLIVVHGLPNSPGGAARAAQTFPELADRIASDTGWASLSCAFRGASGSGGSFSPGNWLADLQAAIEFFRTEVSTVWLAGFGIGGTIALRAAALDPAIGGVAVLGTPTDLSPWVSHPELLAQLAFDAGALPDGIPDDLSAWSQDLRTIDPLRSAAAVPPRPLLIVHGSADAEVPLVDARALNDAAEGQGDLRVVPMAGHRLRHDPRAIAVLLGWLERREAVPRSVPSTDAPADE
ncbi:MAG: hypothetical protein NVS3B21_23200 [Acidimicrobiales bacterium]